MSGIYGTDSIEKFKTLTDNMKAILHNVEALQQIKKQDHNLLKEIQDGMNLIEFYSQRLIDRFAREQVVNWAAENKAWLDAFIKEREKKI